MLRNISRSDVFGRACKRRAWGRRGTVDFDGDGVRWPPAWCSVFGLMRGSGGRCNSAGEAACRRGRADCRKRSSESRGISGLGLPLGIPEQAGHLLPREHLTRFSCAKELHLAQQRSADARGSQLAVAYDLGARALFGLQQNDRGFLARHAIDAIRVLRNFDV